MAGRPRGWWVALLFLIGVAGAALLVVQTSGAPGPDRSLERVQRAGELVVGLDPSYPPFEVINGQGQLDGFDVGLTQELARRLGVTCRFVTIDFGGIFDALIVGRFDIIVGGISPFPEYARVVSYSRPYFDDGLILVENPEATGHTVGLESGSDADLAIDEIRPKLAGYDFRQFDEQDQIRAALEQKTVRGAIVDAVTGTTWARQHPGLILNPTRLTSVPFVVATRRGDRKLLGAVDAALDAMRRDGVLARLAERWLQ